jgi:hypothetical protein
LSSKVWPAGGWVAGGENSGTGDAADAPAPVWLLALLVALVTFGWVEVSLTAGTDCCSATLPASRALLTRDIAGRLEVKASSSDLEPR